MSEEDVRAALKTVEDPELGVNIVDLGLIYEIKVGNTIYIKMTLTTVGCPLAGYFVEQVKQAVMAGLQVEEDQVMVEVVFDPPWSQELMSEEAKAQLGF